MSREEFENSMDGLFDDVGIELINDECEADSLTYMALIAAIEEEFGIELPDEFLITDSLKNISLFKSMIYELI